MAKQPAPFFLSHARNDRADIERFLTAMGELFAISPNYSFQMWNGAPILAGEKWKEEIARALDSCRFGLVCVSPNFLASGFIKETDFQTLLAHPKVVPVGLHRVLFDGSSVVHLKGLTRQQLFLDSQGRAFSACGRKNGRREFGIELMQVIGTLLGSSMA